MDGIERIRAGLRGLVEVPVQVYVAVVKSIEGSNCTVDIASHDLYDVGEVNLRADDEATEGVLVVPRVGSVVYVAAVDNAVDKLFVCQVAEVDRVEVVIGQTKAVIDKGGLTAQNSKTSLTLTSSTASLKQDSTTVELTGGKVAIKNVGTSLKGLFDDLTTLLQTFTVTCAAPGAPSAPFPATVAQVNTLKARVATLLS